MAGEPHRAGRSPRWLVAAVLLAASAPGAGVAEPSSADSGRDLYLVRFADPPLAMAASAPAGVAMRGAKSGRAGHAHPRAIEGTRGSRSARRCEA